MDPKALLPVQKVQLRNPVLKICIVDILKSFEQAWPFLFNEKIDHDVRHQHLFIFADERGKHFLSNVTNFASAEI